MATLAEIYDWFMTGKKPTQAQFWASWGSFWNKGEQIPQSAISNLTTVLNAKAEKAQFDAHKTDENAHAALFDAKEDKSQKGVAGGYVPLDEFVKIANEYLTIVNDLVTGGSTSLASAETVKTLKTQIDGINTLLTSNDVNLDTVQEIVDAIKTVETSLSTILVNDLTTGGTTKALTAEMGKTLKGLIDGLYANETIDTLLAGKANQILALKTITGTTYNVIYDDISNELVYEGTVAMNVIIPNNATLALPIGTVFYSVATNTGILSVSGGAGVVFQTAVGLSGSQNEVRKYTKRGINTWGVEGNVTSSSDMILASTQIVSGLKTFLNGMFGLRNVANTFTSFFTNANTASRTYTLQNRNGTLADDTDLAGKMAVPAGNTNFLSKFLTSTTIGLSRIVDTGSSLGIGTVNSPTKDITFGNQANREIGIEEDFATMPGKSLTLKAGRANDFIVTSTVTSLSTGLSFNSISMLPNGDLYGLMANGNLYKRANSTTAFVLVSSTGHTYSYLYTDSTGILYLLNPVWSFSSPIYSVNTTSYSLTLVETFKSPVDYLIASNGYTYVVGGSGPESPFGNINRRPSTGGLYVEITSGLYFNSICESNSNIYATVVGGDIYVQYSGVGSFIPLSQTYRNWSDIYGAPNGNVYATVAGGDIYVQYSGVGSFIPLSQTYRNWRKVYGDSSNNIYIAEALDLYYMDNSAKGIANLDGGTLKNIAGTGKGGGKSRYEIYTGQKTALGTDMQIETLREYIDENGYHIYTSMPVFADNAAAITGGLPIGCEYRTASGVKMIVY